MRPPNRKGREALVSMGEGKGEVQLVLPSNLTADEMDAFAQANVELLEAVGESMGTPMPFRVGRFRIVCDGCGKERPASHDDWHQTATGHDYCPACQTPVSVEGEKP